MSDRCPAPAPAPASDAASRAQTESGPDSNAPKVFGTNPSRWNEFLILLVSLLAALLSMSPNVADPDLWGHVQYGRDALAAGEIPRTTSYSFTAEGFRWVNHENLAEIVMAVVAEAGGPLGLVAGKMLLALVVLLLAVTQFFRQKLGGLPAAALLLLLGANLGYHWSIRPQLATFASFALMVSLVELAFRNWSPVSWNELWRSGSSRHASAEPGNRPWNARQILWLWLVPPLMVIWTNSHGGFLAGLAVFVCYMGLRCAECVVRQSVRAGEKRSWLPAHLAVIALATAGATLVNPYGWGLHQWLLQSLGQPRPEISDWATNELTSLVGMKLWALVAISGLALGLSRRRRDWVQCLLLGLTLWQAVSHFRHVPFFAILAVAWLGPHLESALGRIQALVLGRQSQPPVAGRSAVVFQVILLLAVGLIGWRLSARASDLPVMRDKFPVDAVAHMRQHGWNGKLVVTYDWAQYAIAAFCVPEASPTNGQAFVQAAVLNEPVTEQRHAAVAAGSQAGPVQVGTAAGPACPADCGQVAFDGRFRTCYPQQVIDMHFDFLYGHTDRMRRHRSEDSPACDPHRVLEYGQPDLVLISRRGERTSEHMQQVADQWVLLYQDGISQVWGRRSKFDDPDLASYVPVEDRLISNAVPRGSVRWPAIW